MLHGDRDLLVSPSDGEWKRLTMLRRNVTGRSFFEAICDSLKQTNKAGLSAANSVTVRE